MHVVRAGEQEGSAAGGCEPGVSREREWARERTSPVGLGRLSVSVVGALETLYKEVT